MKKIDMDLLSRKLAFINSIDRKVNLMEVCGTHTMAIGRYGVRNVLGDNINLISGPGCPVCVTPDVYINYIYDLALKKDIIIATYGDMIRVPGSRPEITLEKAKASGAAVRMVYSSMDALRIAEENPEKKVVFLGIGFETTAPATAVALKEALGRRIGNFYVLSMHKLVEPVMRVLLDDEELKVDGFICPGHVAVIIGEEGFKFLEEYNCPAAIAGFELEEIVDGIYSIVSDIRSEGHTLKNVYKAVVRPEGNHAAKEIINEVFDVADDMWRGIGIVKNSGLKLKKEFKEQDIEQVYPIDLNKFQGHTSGCQCGEVLKGKLRPHDCKLFGKVCNPENPVGPCMVSGEGSCAAYYRFNIK